MAPQTPFTEIVHRAHKAGLAGATALHGVEGFGASNLIHTTRLLSLSEDLPVVIVIVVTHDRIHAFLPHLDELVTEGLVILDDCEVIRYAGRHPKTQRTNRRSRNGGHDEPAAGHRRRRDRCAAALPHRPRRPDPPRHRVPVGHVTVIIVGSLIPRRGRRRSDHHRRAAPVQLLVGTGFCGAVTTCSTFSYESLRLIEQDAKFFAAANLAASIIAGLGGAFLGAAIGQAIWP